MKTPELGSAQNSLHRAVDDLVTRAMLSTGGPEEIAPILSALDALAQQADDAGLTTVGTAARELQSRDGGEALLEGLSQLQDVLRDSADQAAAKPAAPVSLGADPELLADFIVESRDHLSAIETQVLALEQDPTVLEPVHPIFRAFHTIKGLAGFLELPAIQEAAHEIETMLDLVRNGQLPATPALVDVVLAGGDYLRNHVDCIEARLHGKTAQEPTGGAHLLARVKALMSGEAAAPAPVPMPDEAVPAQKEAAPAAEPQGESKKQTSVETSVVKVDTGKLDFLVDMVGEMVIAQSMIHHDSAALTQGNQKIQRNLAQLARITGDVQKTAMSMRMVPIGTLFQKSARLIRDLTRKSGKHIELEMVGEDTELDRTIVDELGDPLMHMIRNGVDHGIETPEERAKTGKPPVAKIQLKAYHQSGHIIVEVSDDGRGLRREKIIAKARERGLIQGDGSNLSDKEVFNLIFEPGFSTAEKVTDLSGRGVGMDVVRKQVQKLRGRVDIESEAGSGSKFFIKLPLTLAIIDGLIVGIGQERYIVPIYVVHEIFKPQADTIFTVEGRDEMMLIRGQLMPVVRLYKRFGVKPNTEDLTEALIVVAEAHEKKFCVVVDELIGKQEVVIKCLGEAFRHIPGLAGGAILGDGRVGLIVDMDSLFNEAARV